MTKGSGQVQSDIKKEKLKIQKTLKLMIYLTKFTVTKTIITSTYRLNSDIGIRSSTE